MGGEVFLFILNFAVLLKFSSMTDTSVITTTKKQTNKKTGRSMLFLKKTSVNGSSDNEAQSQDPGLRTEPC